MASFRRLLLLTSTLSCLMAPMAHAADKDSSAPAAGTNSFVDALTGGTPYLDMRYRHEDVHQDGIRNDASASTLRTIVGYNTGTYQHFKASVAALNTSSMPWSGSYDDGGNGKTTFPRVGDPNDTQLHLANLTWDGLPGFSVTGGRQYISLDNNRFIGASSWRQIPQSFDAVMLKYSPLSDLELAYGFAFQINRSPGTNVTAGTYDMNTHIMHATYTGIEGLRLAGYAYLADIKNLPNSSSATVGSRAEGKYPLMGDLKATGTAEYARYSDYGNNPGSFGLNYYLLEPGLAYGGLTGKFGYEVMEGNGTYSVQTPLAALHSFNGWADKFQTTPVGGLEDTYVATGYSFQTPVDIFGKTKIQFEWHSYSANTSTQHYGNEYNVNFEQPFLDHYSVGLKYADYKADTLFTDTRKVVMTAQMRF
jgi:hypothetical protein